MQKLLETFKDIIVETSVTKYEVSGENIKLRMKLHLVDGSDLYVRETVIDGEKRKYSYHWQDKNKKLIKRWDNAPDWDVDTFPHHLHIAENRVVASYDRNIERILHLIREELDEG